MMLENILNMELYSSHQWYNRDYLNADNEIEFNDAIIKLLDNKKLYKYIADNGHALVEKKYSWTTSMNKLDDIITKIVENKKS